MADATRGRLKSRVRWHRRIRDREWHTTYLGSRPLSEDHYIMLVIQYMIIVVLQGSRRRRGKLCLAKFLNMACLQRVPLPSFIYVTRIGFTSVNLESAFLYSKTLLCAGPSYRAIVLGHLHNGPTK
jgi:hypothetical protein